MFLPLLAVQILFGINYNVSKVVVSAFPPLLWASMRSIIAACCMVILALALRRPHPKDGKRFFLPLIVFALLGNVINQGAFLFGLRFTTPTNGALLNSLIPVFTLLIVTWRRHEPLTLRKLCGFLSAFIGALMLLHIENFTLSDKTLIGDLLMLVNALSYGFFLAYTKKFFDEHDWFWTTAWLFVYGSIGLSLLALPNWLEMNIPPMTPLLWGCATYVIIGATLLTYLLNNWTLSRTHSSNVALFIYVQPVVASILAWFWFGQAIAARTFYAAVLIFLSVFFVLTQKQEAPAPEPA